jgi:hypothetical protein
MVSVKRILCGWMGIYCEHEQEEVRRAGTLQAPLATPGRRLGRAAVARPHDRGDPGPDPLDQAPEAPQAGDGQEPGRLRRRPGHPRPVPLRGQPDPSPQRAAGDRDRPPGPRRRRGGHAGAGEAEPPVRHLGGQEVPEPGHGAHGSDRGRQRRAAHRGAEVRPRPGGQVHLLRGVVDPPGDPRLARPAGPHRPRPAQPHGRPLADHPDGRDAPAGAAA